MACRRCSTCNINYPTVWEWPCRACGGTLSYFSNIEPDRNLKKRVSDVLWSPVEGPPLYGGTTLMTRFERTLESLIGPDDFLFECGDRPAPAGHE